jgi:hypothetical protein
MKFIGRKEKEAEGYSHFGCKSGKPYSWLDKPSKTVKEFTSIKENTIINSEISQAIAIEYTR